METIIFKAPVGTKEKLRELNPNISDFCARQPKSSSPGAKRSAHERAKHLIFRGNGRGARGKEYLQVYATKPPLKGIAGRQRNGGQVAEKHCSGFAKTEMRQARAQIQ